VCCRESCAKYISRICPASATLRYAFSLALLSMKRLINAVKRWLQQCWVNFALAAICPHKRPCRGRKRPQSEWPSLPNITILALDATRRENARSGFESEAVQRLASGATLPKIKRPVAPGWGWSDGPGGPSPPSGPTPGGGGP
jgi:hypothetical protein